MAASTHYFALPIYHTVHRAEQHRRCFSGGLWHVDFCQGPLSDSTFRPTRLRSTMTRFGIALLALCMLAVSPFADAQETVKVFILAGQSNMEGKAPTNFTTIRRRIQAPSALRASPQRRSVDRSRRCVHQVPRPQGATHPRIRITWPHRGGVGVWHGDRRAFQRACAPDQNRLGRTFALQNVSAAFGRIARRRDSRQGVTAGSGQRARKQREKQAPRPAANDRRHQAGLRIVVPQDDR